MRSGSNVTSTRRPTRSKLSEVMPGRASAWRTSAASSAQSMPATCRRISELLDGGKHFLGVAINLHAVPALDHFSIRADQIRGPRHAHVLLAVHGFLLPHAVLLDHRMILVGEQRELQPVLVRELRLAPRVEHADAQHGGLALLELRQVVLERAGLRGATWGVVFWIEVQDDRLTGVVSEVVRLAGLVRQ